MANSAMAPTTVETRMVGPSACACWTRSGAAMASARWPKAPEIPRRAMTPAAMSQTRTCVAPSRRSSRSAPNAANSAVERHDEEHHARGARLAHVRHDTPPELVEWCRLAERDQQEQDADPTRPPHQAPAFRVRAAGESQDRERDHRQPEVLRVQLQRIRAPVR